MHTLCLHMSCCLQSSKRWGEMESNAKYIACVIADFWSLGSIYIFWCHKCLVSGWHSGIRSEVTPHAMISMICYMLRVEHVNQIRPWVLPQCVPGDTDRKLIARQIRFHERYMLWVRAEHNPNGDWKKLL